MDTVWTYPVLADITGRPVVIAVHDGDTARLLLDAGCDGSAHPWLRFRGVFCPELGRPGGPEATVFTRDLLAGSRAILVHVHGRSFGRWVATIVCDGVDIADTIIAAGHGTPTAKP